MKLSPDFYTRTNVVEVARDLIGKTLVTKIDSVVCAGTIVETEAYSWSERGCHAFDSKMTPRNRIMFGTGGHAYVYLCYGIHCLFNVVTNVENVAEAVLVRAVEPVEGVEHMALRRRIPPTSSSLTSGPGKLTQALGITRLWNGQSLLGDEIWIEDRRIVVPEHLVQPSPRIGIDFAGADALLPWRFSLAGNRWVSRP